MNRETLICDRALRQRPCPCGLMKKADVRLEGVIRQEPTWMSDDIPLTGLGICNPCGLRKKFVVLASPKYFCDLQEKETPCQP